MDEGGWLKRDFERLHLIAEELDAVEWHAAEKDRRKVAKFLVGELEEIEVAYGKNEFDFTELETGVHELRRQLRWVSIYAQSLDGLGGTGAVSFAILLGGGVLVGFGTRMAGGCTSGHGLSGCSRLQPGSLVATATFLGTAIGVSLLAAAVLR